MALHEERNAFNMFAIKMCLMGDWTTAAYLPRDISWSTKYLTERGAKLSSTDCRNSPLFQGGLKIRCVATMTLLASIKGHMLIQRCREIVEELYCEPKEEIIMGFFSGKKKLLMSTSAYRNQKKDKRQNISCGKTKRVSRHTQLLLWSIKGISFAISSW